MKVELSIEANQMGETVVSMFQNLSPQKKEEIAADMVKNWLNLPYDAERTIKEKQVIEKLQKEYPNDRDFRDDYSCRQSYRFREEMNKFKSVREQFLLDVTKEVIALVQKQIVEHISTDEGIKKIMEETLVEIKKDFPKFVHDAMIAYFCSNMAGLAAGMAQALATSTSAQELARNASERLNQLPPPRY